MSATRNPNFSSSPMRARKRKLFFVRFYIILFLILTVFLVLAILSGHEKVRVQTIIVSGNAAVSADEILTIADRDMAGRYWHLFSKSNSLIFPRFQISRDILAEIKTVKNLNISWKNWQTITINIEERRPHSVWCGDDPGVMDSVCYLVDKNGYIYSEAPIFTGSIFIKDYGGISTSTNPLGQYYLPGGEYRQVFDLVNLLDQNGLRIVRVSYDGLDFRFTLDTGPVIIFNTKNSFDSSFANLFTAVETKSLDLMKDAGAISYIDLRYDSKIVIGKKGN